MFVLLLALMAVGTCRAQAGSSCPRGNSSAVILGGFGAASVNEKILRVEQGYLPPYTVFTDQSIYYVDVTNISRQALPAIATPAVAICRSNWGDSMVDYWVATPTHVAFCWTNGFQCVKAFTTTTPVTACTDMETFAGFAMMASYDALYYCSSRSAAVCPNISLPVGSYKDPVSLISFMAPSDKFRSGGFLYINGAQVGVGYNFTQPQMQFSYYEDPPLFFISWTDSGMVRWVDIRCAHNTLMISGDNGWEYPLVSKCPTDFGPSEEFLSQYIQNHGDSGFRGTIALSGSVEVGVRFWVIGSNQQAFYELDTIALDERADASEIFFCGTDSCVGEYCYLDIYYVTRDPDTKEMVFKLVGANTTCNSKVHWLADEKHPVFVGNASQCPVAGKDRGEQCPDNHCLPVMLKSCADNGPYSCCKYLRDSCNFCCTDCPSGGCNNACQICNPSATSVCEKNNTRIQVI